jgi:hypothetical protein
MIYVSSISQANGSIRTSPECVRDVLSCHRQRESVCESPPGRQLRETRIPSPLCWPWVGLENARLVAQCLELGVSGTGFEEVGRIGTVKSASGNSSQKSGGGLTDRQAV